MRRAARVDANQAAIVDALVTCRASVLSLAGVGRGCPDLLVGHHGETYLFEVKDGSRVPSERQLTPLEKVFFAQWRGGELRVIESPSEALAAIGVRV